MAESHRLSKSSNDKLLLLREYQNQYAEGTKNWVFVQGLIDKVVAQRFLEYVTR